jgi:hypothetical protein
MVAVPVTPLAAVVECAARKDPIDRLLVAKSRLKFAGSVSVPHERFNVVEIAPIMIPPDATVSPDAVVMRGEVLLACPTFASVLVAVSLFAPLSSYACRIPAAERPPANVSEYAVFPVPPSANDHIQSDPTPVPALVTEANVPLPEVVGVFGVRDAVAIRATTTTTLPVVTADAKFSDHVADAVVCWSSVSWTTATGIR